MTYDTLAASTEAHNGRPDDLDENEALKALSDRFNPIFAATGPLLDDIDAIVQNSDNAWTFGFLDGSALLVECVYDDSGTSIVFSAPIGQPTAESETRVLEALMRFNGAWRDTGGVRAVKFSATDELALVYEWASPDVDPGQVAEVVKNLADLQERWAGWVRRADHETGALGIELA